MKTQPAATEEGGRVYAVLELTNENGQRQRAYGYAVEVELLSNAANRKRYQIRKPTRYGSNAGETEKTIWIDT